MPVRVTQNLTSIVADDGHGSVIVTFSPPGRMPSVPVTTALIMRWAAARDALASRGIGIAASGRPGSRLRFGVARVASGFALQATARTADGNVTVPLAGYGVPVPAASTDAALEEWAAAADLLLRRLADPTVVLPEMLIALAAPDT